MNTVHMTVDGSATRASLLDIARTIVVNEGTADFSLREVARRAGLSPAAVYRHFASKEALLDEVCAIGFQKLCMYLLSATSAKTPRARLDASGDAYLRFALENPEDYRAIFMTPSRGKKPGSPGEAFQLLMDRVRECMDAKVLERGGALGTRLEMRFHLASRRGIHAPVQVLGNQIGPAVGHIRLPFSGTDAA